MKKFLMMLAVFTLCIAMCASVAVAEMPAGMLSVNAITKNFEVYHHIAALVVEYADEIVAPELDAFTFVDTAPATYSAAEERRDSDQAVVTAVYTNDAPEMREDKTSVAGKYLIVELEGDFPVVWDSENERYIVENVACMATWRHQGEGRQRIRKDYSELTITQNVDILNKDGKVVAAACTLPTLNQADMVNLIIDDFEVTSIKSPRGYDYYYALYLPKNYDPAQKYPMVVSVAGNGSRLDYSAQDEDGNLLCIGAQISADQVATYFAEHYDDVIVLAPQPWAETPEEWGVDNVKDTIYLVDYIKSNYAVDLDRVYAIGSSFGGMHLSQVLTARPDLATAYLACNTSYSGLTTMFDDDMPSGSFKGATPEEVIETTTTHMVRKDAYIESAREVLKPLADEGVKVYVLHAANDETITASKAVYFYNALREVYKDAEYTDEEIEAMLTMNIVSDEIMLENGICKFHSCSKYAVLDENVVNWLMAQ